MVHNFVSSDIVEPCILHTGILPMNKKTKTAHTSESDIISKVDVVTEQIAG